MQSHCQIAIETLTQTAAGFGLSLLVTYYVLPLAWGLEPSLRDAWEMTLLYTLISLGRGYLVRRWFNA